MPGPTVQTVGRACLAAGSYFPNQRPAMARRRFFTRWMKVSGGAGAVADGVEDGALTAAGHWPLRRRVLRQTAPSRGWQRIFERYRCPSFFSIQIEKPGYLTASPLTCRARRGPLLRAARGVALQVALNVRGFVVMAALAPDEDAEGVEIVRGVPAPMVVQSHVGFFSSPARTRPAGNRKRYGVLRRTGPPRRGWPSPGGASAPSRIARWRSARGSTRPRGRRLPVDVFRGRRRFVRLIGLKRSSQSCGGPGGLGMGGGGYAASFLDDFLVAALGFFGGGR